MTSKIFFNKINLILILFIIFITIPKLDYASEVLIYGDTITYDNEQNIIAKGKAKVIYNNEIILSDLIIYKRKLKQIYLPIEFSLRDEKNNYYYGTSGEFDQTLEKGTIQNAKMLLNDGSRIVGTQATRNAHIDIITKGVYSPCLSKIKIANFLCPIWQLEGEKILHDYNKLFLYQKHAKMKIANTPVFYLPYLVTPSPLRKKRKSGFLSPSVNFEFFDTEITQSTSLPYYFNISEDKELTFVPTIHYGGGVDSSQRFIFDYNQIISGGNFNFDLTVDSNIERENTDKWLSDASLIVYYKQNLNENYRVNFSSALQTSKNYIQTTDPNSELSYTSSLSTKLDLHGYNLRKYDDQLLINFSTYQVSQNNENNNTTPTVLPYVDYQTGKSYYKGHYLNNNFTFYNIFRNSNTKIHSRRQQKISHTFLTNNELIKYGTRIKLSSETHNQFYNTEDMKADGNYSGGNYRAFPIAGMSLETPFKFTKNFFNLTYTPNTMLVLSPGFSNSNKISNEDSSINTYSIDNNLSLNRYSGTDKLDNSKRINYGITVNNDTVNLELFQSYEFTENSNFHYTQGNEENLSDLLGKASYAKNKSNANYNFRYDVNEDYLKRQNVSVSVEYDFANINLSYLDQRSKTDEIITTDKETLSYNILSKKFAKYSIISFNGLYDFKEDINKEYSISYKYYDECFGVNLDFKRNSYTDDDLKPTDTLTVMFSFKNIGSYRSTNLAVSEQDKQDIEWIKYAVKNTLFDDLTDDDISDDETDDDISN